MPKRSQPKQSFTKNTKGYSNTISITAGKWKNTKLTFQTINGLRPTHNHIRETLFNWLMHDIYQATCLDLFSGTGVLGFEAVSRGAQHSTLIENNVIAYQDLNKTKQKLNSEQITIINTSYDNFLHKLIASNKTFDIIFLDPPFEFLNYEKLLSDVAKISHKNSLIYLEIDLKTNIALNDSFNILKSKQKGNVSIHLLRKK